MQNSIELYIRKILEIGCNIKEKDNLIVYTEEEIPELKETLLKIKADYKINQIVFINNDYEKIYNFLMNNPTDEEIRKFIIKYPDIKQKEKTKLINIEYDDFEGYKYKLGYEIYDKYSKYQKIDYEINKEIYDLFKKNPSILTIFPTNAWSKNLFGSINQKDKLLDLLLKTFPTEEETKKLQYIKDYLNQIKIRELYFYTKSGTDLRIRLSKNSVWVTQPAKKNNIEYFSNFPSYEIFTAPDYNQAEGKVIITRPSILYGNRIEQAELSFSQGKLISCKSDNEFWAEIVMYEESNLNRIGEIALLSNDTPIARLNQKFNSLLLDENAGCHLALGNSYQENINIPKEILKLKGKKHYNYNDSLYHQDLTFGDDSIIVEVKTKHKTKLLLKDGKWQI